MGEKNVQNVDVLGFVPHLMLDLMLEAQAAKGNANHLASSKPKDWDVLLRGKHWQGMEIQAHLKGSQAAQ